MSKRKPRPTQLDIARTAGVSPAVVSLVVNGVADGKVKIAKATQARVRAVIEEMGYVPNLAARQLAGGITDVIGVFTYDPVFPLQPDNFYQPFLMGIEEQAAELDFNMLLFTGGAKREQKAIYKDGQNCLLSTQGAILLGRHENREELARLHADGFPFVFVGHRRINGEAIACTAADYAGGTKQLLQILLEAGHRNVLYVGTPDIHESADDRESGFVAALDAAGIPSPRRWILRRDLSNLAVSDLRQWIGQGVTALAVEAMPVARQIVSMAQEHGISVPGDLSIVALGNDPEDSQPRPITSFAIPKREMGASAVVLLNTMLREPNHTFAFPWSIDCQPQRGDTVGAPGGLGDIGKEVSIIKP